MTTLLVALDPDLLIYDPEDFGREDWQQDTKHSALRLAALSLHRQMIKEYNLKIVISEPLWSWILEHFPWNTKDFDKVRDFRTFMLGDLTRRRYVVELGTCQEISLNPAHAVCYYVENENVVHAWEQLLVGCAEKLDPNQFDPHIATWENPVIISHLKSDVLKMKYSREGEDNQEYTFQVISAIDRWYTRLVAQDWWPDLELMVELHFKTNDAIQKYKGVRTRPRTLHCTPRFRASIDQHCCDVQKQKRLIEALTKVVYDVRDVGLGLEKIGKYEYRFRVTDFWRVHCLIKQDQVILDEFGPHRIDGVG